ncbi:MAG: tetratricopeptide repeat protein [Deltaproteobacteria bacterium]|nr:tetratricopeptide repeat protein [Deltaproteobacteria bacterium]
MNVCACRVMLCLACLLAGACQTARKARALDNVTVESLLLKPQGFFILSREKINLPDLRSLGVPASACEALARKEALSEQRSKVQEGLGATQRDIDPKDAGVTAETLEELEQAARKAAIGACEEHLRVSRGDPETTPAVLLHLAELYYQQEWDEHCLALHAYEEQAANGIAPQPSEPRFAPRKALGLLRSLLRQFPTWSMNDAALYLSGLCLERLGEPELSRDAFQQLVEGWPNSAYALEGWLRLGEYWFDMPNEPKALEKAAEAYGRLIAHPDHRYYDKALYKLGWTWYRLDAFEKLVDVFTRLVDFVDRGSRMEDSNLRDEALQYMALSFADERWGSIEKAELHLAGIGPRPWAQELWNRIARVHSDLARPDLAAQAKARAEAMVPSH